MPYENCEDCKRCLPCPVTSGDKNEGAYPISQDTGNPWYCTSCFYCEDVCPDYSPRQYAIDKRRKHDQDTKTMNEPLDVIREHGHLFEITESLNDFRVDLGLPKMLKPKVSDLDKLSRLIMGKEGLQLSKKTPREGLYAKEKPKVALFLGCLIPYRVPEYELSARNILTKMNIDYVDLPFVCCGSIMTESQSEELWLTTAAYSLALAEESGIETILALCGGCSNNLRRVNIILKEDKTKLEMVNKYIEIVGKQYKKTIKVEHILDFLHDASYQKKVESLINSDQKELLKKVSSAIQIPCQVIRPEKYSPNASLGTKLMDDILALTGLSTSSYPFETLCCGSSMLQHDEELALKIAKKRIDSLLKRNFDTLILGCGNCSMNFNIHQSEYSKVKLPTLFFTEIIDFAFGTPNETIEKILKRKRLEESKSK
ncbi:MAG: heterodisulfide reductase-related iron-sulfur binding cluster [Candidatus Heimdallarchaeota archaeon]